MGEMLLRAGAGLASCRTGCATPSACFLNPGAHNLTALAKQLDEDGYRPGRTGRPPSPSPSLSRPMLALGLTRLVAVPIVIFLVVSNYERWRVGGYFWNKTGLEYTLMWTLAAFYFLVHGGGAISVDHLLIGREW
jgi:hypothetical protein